MKTLIEVMAAVLLAVPVALLIIFDLPGLGLVLAMVLVAGYIYKMSMATPGPITQGAGAGGKLHAMKNKDVARDHRDTHAA